LASASNNGNGQRSEKSAQEDLIDTATKPDAAIDLDDGDARVELLAQLRFVVDRNGLRIEAIPTEQMERVVAERAAVACVKNYFRHPVGCSMWLM
jgi:hypothetical protein